MLRKLSGNNVPHCRLIYPTAGRRQGAVAGPAGATTASGLRVSPCWHPQNLLDLRTPGRLATRCHHPAAHHAGLCPPDAMARGRGLPPSSGGPSCPGQPEHPPCGLPLRDLSRGRGPSITKRLESWRKSSSAYCPETACRDAYAIRRNAHRLPSTGVLAPTVPALNSIASIPCHSQIDSILAACPRNTGGRLLQV